MFSCFRVTLLNAVLLEAHRVLKPRGRLAIIDWSESFGGLGPVAQDVVAEALANATSGRGGPFAAAVVDLATGAVVGRGRNTVTSDPDPTAHAEVLALREAARRLDTILGEVDRCVVKGQALEAQSDAHPEGGGRAEIAVQLHAAEDKPMPLPFHHSTLIWRHHDS